MAKRKSSGVRYPRGPGWLPIGPRKLPSFRDMFDDIGASPSRLAEHLGCCRSAVYRWLDGEPFERRAYQLAMFYETQWGRSFVSTKVENEARLYGAQMLFLRREVERLQGLLLRLGAIGDFGSSNDPAEEVPAFSQAAVRECFEDVEAMRDSALRRSA